MNGIITLISGAVSLFKSNIENDKLETKAKSEFKIANIEYKKQLLDAKSKMLVSDLANEAKLDLISTENMNSSYKDETILYLFTIPIFLSFTPYHKQIESGYESLDKMPTWMLVLYCGMIIVIFGMRGLFSKFADKFMGFKK